MEKHSQRKKNIEILEDIHLALKGLLSETNQMKNDIQYIKLRLDAERKVREDKAKAEPIETGWRLW
tara:strand:+ start:521 stop:718 length:198 start_codon:yes stop_codon:yes gene_type:complete